MYVARLLTSNAPGMHQGTSLFTHRRWRYVVIPRTFRTVLGYTRKKYSVAIIQVSPAAQPQQHMMLMAADLTITASPISSRHSGKLSHPHPGYREVQTCGSGAKRLNNLPS